MFDTLMVFLKYFFLKVEFEKESTDEFFFKKKRLSWRAPLCPLVGAFNHGCALDTLSISTFVSTFKYVKC